MLTSGSKKYSKVQSVNLRSQSKVNIEVDGLSMIVGIVEKEDGSKKLMEHTPTLRFKSSNTNVATVSKSGIIQGMRAGNCSIYMYASNGMYQKISVHVS